MSLHSTQILKTRTSYKPGPSHAVDYLWNVFGAHLTTLSMPYGQNLAKKTVLHALSGITSGRLTVKAEDDRYVFGDNLPSSSPDVTLIIKADSFWQRLVLFSDLGLAESFMSGEIDCDDISGLIRIIIANRQLLEVNVSGFASSVLALGRRLTAYKFLGDVSTSPANISAHYDLGNTMFQSFLSEDMNYSSAIFMDYNEDLVKDPSLCEPLEIAQERKMLNIIKRANIQPGDRVLEIGTGWGALSILIARTVDCVVDTVTLSGEQRDLAVARIAQAGLSDCIHVHHMDFRLCRKKAEWAGFFDRFVSVEMIENVGKDFIEEYWRVVDWALKPKSAIGVVQVITMPERRIPAYDKSGADFIQKWIFPGCYMPSLCFLVNTLNTGSGGRLTVDSVSNIGPHYARTLREWKRKFLANWEATISPALFDQYELNEETLEVFKRKWIYYFDYCEAGFATRSLGDHVITFTREGNIEFGCDFVPPAQTT